MGRTDYNRPKEDVESDRERGFVLPYHREMVADRERVARFRAAILATCSGRTVLEIGCGTGVLSAIAAQVADRVIAVEFDPQVARIAAQTFERSPFSDRIDLVEQDIRGFEIPAGIEVVICENLSTGLVNEPQVAHMNLVARALPSSVVRIPTRVVNLCEAVEADFRFGEVEVRVPYYEFTGLQPPRMLSESRIYSSFCFGPVLSEEVDGNVVMEALAGGVVNALRLTSIVHLIDGVSFYSTDSLMPPVVVPVDDEVRVRPGDLIEGRLGYRCGGDWPGCRASVQVRPGAASGLALLEQSQAFRHPTASIVDG